MPDAKRHPIQPLEMVGTTLRFKQNAIVRYLLDQGPFDLNHIATLPFTKEDHEQLAQLIGYSLGGFGELGYVSDEVYGAAQAMHDDGMSEADARIESLRRQMASLQDAARKSIELLTDGVGNEEG